jgi:hypothetical protein
VLECMPPVPPKKIPEQLYIHSLHKQKTHITNFLCSSVVNNYIVHNKINVNIELTTNCDLNILGEWDARK